MGVLTSTQKRVGITMLCFRIPVKNSTKGWLRMSQAKYHYPPLGSCLHLALKSSPLRQRIWSQNLWNQIVLGWNASCHFTMVNFKLLSFFFNSDLISIKWTHVHYLHSYVTMQKMHSGGARCF